MADIGEIKSKSICGYSFNTYFNSQHEKIASTPSGRILRTESNKKC